MAGLFTICAFTVYGLPDDGGSGPKGIVTAGASSTTTAATARARYDEAQQCRQLLPLRQPGLLLSI